MITIQETLLQEISNRKKHDKHSIAYMIGMMNHHDYCRLAPETYLRQEIVDRFTTYIYTDKLNRLSSIPSFKPIFEQYKKSI